MTSAKDKLANLTPAQRDLLLKRLAARKNAAGTAIAKQTANGPVSVSFAQERQFFQDIMSPKEPSHIIIGALAFDGTLNVTALQETLNAIYMRHETLRANFRLTEEGIEQEFRTETSVPLKMVDVKSQAEFQTLYAAECGRGFDLKNDRLLRATLVSKNASQHWLIFSMHHIASDGWSIGIFLNELLANYRDTLAGVVEHRPSRWTYGAFAHWQRKRLAEGHLDKGFEYWRDQLVDPPDVLELLPDQKGAQRRDHAGAALSHEIGSTIKNQIASQAQKAGTSPFVVLLAGFAVLMHRLSGQDDFIVGTPVSGRSRVETEDLIGLFLNTIPLRMLGFEGRRFEDIMSQVKTKVLAGLDHQDIPFDKIVQEIAPTRKAGKNPFFELFFNYTPSPPRSLDMPNLKANYVEPPTLRSDFSTALYVTDWEDRIELRLVYQTNRFSKKRMQALLAQYTAVLEQCTVDPHVAISKISLAHGAEPARIENAPPEATVQTSVPASIQDWAKRTPNAVAIEHHGDRLTYKELCDAMNGFARGLRVEGVGIGEVVAISGAPSVQYIIAMAAILRSGAVLVTIANDLPTERVQTMLTEASVKYHWVLDGADAVGSVAPILPKNINDDSGDLEPAPAGPKTPAYIFFTSGSTGTPKAIQGTAGGLAHFLNWQRDAFDVGPEDRCAQLTAMSFDVVLRDVFLPLVSGATLVIPPADRTVLSGKALSWLNEAKISSFHTVPSIIEAWLSLTSDEQSCPNLKRVFFAGEPLTDSLIAKWRGAVNATAQIVNFYGPTETTLAKVFHVIEDMPFDGVQPLGRAIPETEIYVLTKDHAPCGVGEVGEISIRTPFRSLGYLNNTAATERQFIGNPHSKIADDLLYLTGDCGHFDAQGVLHYNGRIDDQVKIRGVRIEPAEVNAVLARHPDVSASYVTTQKLPTSETQLVAYVVPTKPALLGNTVLRKYLADALPAAMVPTAFAVLDALPLNANHKVDRRNLPLIEPQSSPAETEYEAPETDMEQRLARVWGEVLNISAPSVTANFFDLGGHSLLSLRLLARMESEAGFSVPLGEFLAHPTIRSLASRDTDAKGDPSTVVFGEQPSLANLFLVHTGGGTVLNYVPLSKKLQSHRNAIAFQADGILAGTTPQTNFAKMAKDYVARLLAIQPQGPFELGGHSFGGIVAYEMACQLIAAGHEVRKLLLFDSILQPEGSEVSGSDANAQSAVDLCVALDVFERFTGRQIEISVAELSGLSEDEQLEKVETAIGAGLRTNDGMIARFVAIARAHRSARAAHVLRAVAVSTTLFKAENPKAESGNVDRTLGWHSLLSDRLEVIDAEGDHVTMMTEGHSDQLASQVLVALGDDA